MACDSKRDEILLCYRRKSNECHPFFARGSSMQNIMLERLKKNGFPEAIDLPMAVNLKGTQQGQIGSDVF